MLRTILILWTAFLAALLLTLFPTVCSATTFGVHVGSMHMPSRDFNNTNPGVYIRGDSGWLAGYYRNSYRRDTFYAGRMFGDEYALTLALATGYKRRTNADGSSSGFSRWAVTPIAAVSARVGPARVSFVPGLGGSSSVLHLTLEHKF